MHALVDREFALPVHYDHLSNFIAYMMHLATSLTRDKSNTIIIDWIKIFYEHLFKMME